MTTALQQDKEEAKVKAIQRREVLEKVNKMLFHDTNDAKEFHSAAMHCDVLAERAAQIEVKNQLAALRSAQDQAFQRQLKEQLELAEDAEVERLKEAKQRALEQKDAQMRQLDALKERILAEREENKREVSHVFWRGLKFNFRSKRMHGIRVTFGRGSGKSISGH
jgi:hypothetical protein